MSIDLQQTIQEQIRVLSEDEMQQVYNFVQNLSQEKGLRPTKSISSIFKELSSDQPLDNWKALPSDGAENHDHYLYGAPKKTN